jgi:xanthine dehydrogenase accessory factor
VKRRVLRKLLAIRADKQPVALVTHLESGMQCLVFADGTTDQCDQQQFEPAAGIVDRARQSLEEQRSAAAEMEDARYMIRAFVPLPRLFVVGAVHIAQALLPMAGLAGFQVHLIDPREAFGADRRFPEIDVIRQWPDQAFDTLSLDSSSAVVTLSHDPKIDEPALQVALASDAFYVGALGSKKTHAARLSRLSALGIDADTLTRIHAPVGLALGGKAPAEIAVAILAQIIETRYQRQP